MKISNIYISDIYVVGCKENLEYGFSRVKCSYFKTAVIHHKTFGRNCYIDLETNDEYQLDGIKEGDKFLLLSKTKPATQYVNFNKENHASRKRLLKVLVPIAAEITAEKLERNKSL